MLLQHSWNVSFHIYTAQYKLQKLHLSNCLLKVEKQVYFKGFKHFFPEWDFIKMATFPQEVMNSPKLPIVTNSTSFKMLQLLQAMKILVQVVSRNVFNLYIKGREFYFHLIFRLWKVKKKIPFPNWAWWQQTLVKQHIKFKQISENFLPLGIFQLTYTALSLSLWNYIQLYLVLPAENRKFSIFF